MPEVGSMEVIRRSAGEIRFQWRIRGFLSLRPSTFYDSPTISWHHLSSWYMWVGHDSERLRLDLHRVDQGGPTFTLNMSVGSRGPRGVQHQTEREEEVPGRYVWPVWRGDSSSPLLADVRSNLLQPGGSLVVWCHMKVPARDPFPQVTSEATNERVVPSEKRDASIQTEGAFGQAVALAEEIFTSLTEESNTSERRDHVLPEVNQIELLESLSSDLSHILEKKLFPDVRLQCAGQTFQAHRSVLSARSDVFRAMFQNETLESQTGEVEIQDMDVAVLQVLLKSLYSGRLEDISEGNAADLYEAADKYAVMSLKAACAYWIERHLAVENCIRYLVLADSHSDRDLKNAVVSFILKNPGMLKSDAWLALSAELPVLANEVFQTYVTSTIP